MGTKNLRKCTPSLVKPLQIKSIVSQQVSPEDIEVVFDDVKGCDEAKKELQEIVSKRDVTLS